MLEPGDIFAIKGKGITGWLSRNLMLPKTDRFHFGIIFSKCDNDYILLESINKGIAVGRLSFYRDANIRFYRAVCCPKELRTLAALELTNWGRSKYDYLLVAKLILQGFWLLFLKGRKIFYNELTWSKNSSLICTEAVDIAYDSAGVNLIPIDICPTPSAFKQAELDDLIEEVKNE